MEVLYILLVFLTALIPGFLSQSLHEKKGYEGGFAIGFWLGIFGLIYAAGLPCNTETQVDNNPYRPETQATNTPNNIPYNTPTLYKDPNGEVIIICPSCGHRVSPDDAFCDKCGYQMKPSNEIPEKRSSYAANTEVDNDDNEREHTIPCPECGMQIFPDEDCCSNCGYIIKPLKS